MTPAVSVVIPCFNLGAYLDEAVQSVLDQTFRDFEIVIVDDGSDDPLTRHVLASYQRPRTRTIRTENGGVSRARNRGLAEATGRLVSFLDADDVLEPTFLEKTAAALEQDPSRAFASCWLRAFGAAEFLWTPESCEFPHLLAEDTVCTAALTRREAIEAVAGFDPDPRVDGYEDWDLAITLVENGHAGVIIPEFLFRYRIRAGSKSAVRTVPENHASVVEYVVDKHATSFQRHAREVAARIRERIAELEPGATDPPRPSDATLDRRGWREEILDLENQRRALERSQPPRAEDGPGAVEWGTLRGVDPVSRVWGLDRGQPVDRYYIEHFLEANRTDIRGRVLEVKDPGYTRQFGHDVAAVEIVDVAPQNPDATLITDLAQPRSLPENRFDCLILTQTIHYIYDVRVVADNAFRTLRPGGVVLATLPCLSRIDYESGLDADFWRFTPASARRLFEGAFGPGNVEIETYGNVLVGTAFLQGLAAEELSRDELDHVDAYFPVTVGVRARKPDEAAEIGPTEVEGHLDLVTCQAVTGWAWDRAHPARRVTVDVWDGERRVSSALAADFRQDLAVAGKGEGDVAFTAEPLSDLHGDPPLVLHARVGGEELHGSPRPVQCVCGRIQDDAGTEGDHAGRIRVSRPVDNDLLRAYLDAPADGSEVGRPWLHIAGWAVPSAAPLEMVELALGGEVFRTVHPHARPDLAAAFADVPWAGASGFTAGLSLLGLHDDAEITLDAVSSEGIRAAIGRIGVPVSQTDELPVLIAIQSPGSTSNAPTALNQRCRVRRIVVEPAAAGRTSEHGHPGIEVADLRSILAEPGADLIWLTDGDDAVGEDFLTDASRTLAEQPDAAFAVGVEAGAIASPITLVSVLSGRGVGNSVLFRAHTVSLLGGFDDAAPSPAVAQWDLCVRLVAEGHPGTSVPTACPRPAARLSERAGAEGARWLFRRHETLFQARLQSVLLDREGAINESLLENDDLERRIALESRPLLEARHRERDRLAGKLRRLRRGSAEPDRGGGDASVRWGDFRRFTPISPVRGSDRGRPVAEALVAEFLESRAEDIRGAVLDLRSETIGAFDPRDSRWLEQLPSSGYDCVILAHVLQHVVDPEATIAACRRTLRPSGVLLVTVPSVGGVDWTLGADTDFWRFSEDGLRALLEREFDPAAVAVQSRGTRAATVAALAGLAAEDLPRSDLSAGPAGCPVVVTGRAALPAEAGPEG